MQSRLIALAAIAAAVASPVAVAQTWSGFQAGVVVGAGSVRAHFQLPNDPDDPLLKDASKRTRATGGIVAGYNWTFGNTLLGLEADFGGRSDTREVQSCSVHGGCFTPEHDSFTTFNRLHVGTSQRLRLRVGTVADDTLFYAAVGYSHARARMSLEGHCYAPTLPGGVMIYNFAYGSKSLAGYNLAVGAEHFVTTHLFLRAEYMVENFGGETWSGGAPEWNDRHTSLRTGQFRVGLGWQF